MLDSFCFSIPIIRGVQFENEYEVEGEMQACAYVHTHECVYERMNEDTNAVSEHMSTYPYECGRV